MNTMLRIFTAGLLLAVSGCAGGKTDTPNMPDFPLSCAAVLPAVRGSDLDRNPTEEKEEEKALAEGVVVMNKALREYFGSRTDIRMISEELVEPGKPRQSLAGVKATAEKAGCNAVLETTLYRYKERLGGEYTAKEPAATAFTYRLLALPDGTALCRGNFDQEQEPLLNNLLTFRQSAENSFAWVTVERLLTQGLHERLDDCPYLAEKK
ncbi:hypothetical protein [Candidatus Electronema sp. PJ]|uniref:hypothetical protein n=1 Tax=Candidatus Electronema sp. PJ TaxID=3401572 RepID=UPI003AA964E6